jgi:choline-sulfatase
MLGTMPVCKVRRTQGAEGAAQPASERSERAARRSRAKPIGAERERRSTGRKVHLGVVGLALTALCCRPAPPPNVVLVSVDTLRADALGTYGGPLPTPTFDRLAAEGVVFERAFAPTPATAASHATLFTGQEPQRHGLLRNGESLAAGVTPLAEVFRGHGYATAGFVSSFVLDPRFGWSRGFDRYDADIAEAGATLGKSKPYPGAFWSAERFGGFDRRATATTDAARRWLEKAPEPFFLFVHYFDPHGPYVPPAVFADRAASIVVPLDGRELPNVAPAQLEQLIRRYHGEVLYTDDSLAALLEAARRGRMRPTVVAVTADHGEGLGQHRWLEHAVHLYDEQVHVPLLLSAPGLLPAGRRVATPVALADVAPTLLELAGLPAPTPIDGRSLAAAARGESLAPRPIFGVRRLVSEEVGWDRGVKLSVRDGRWKYIWASDAPHELYDLDADPAERRNVLAEHADVAAALRGTIERHVAALPQPKEAAPLSESTREALRALGYVE